jgi:hypothetical protein
MAAATTDASAPTPAEVRVINADEKGMGHGSMGWLEEDSKKFYSAPAQRNMGGITEVMKKHLIELEDDNDKLVIEIGSGSGQHVANYAKQCPTFIFQPTEYPGHPSPKAGPQDLDKILTSIQAYTQGLDNVKAPCFADASKLCDPEHTANICNCGEVAMIVAVNVVHVSPICVMEGILKGAVQLLKPKGKVLFYGPWSIEGVISGEGNIKFQQSLKVLNPEFGIRDVTELEQYLLSDLNGELSVVDKVYFEQSNNYAIVLQKK